MARMTATTLLATARKAVGSADTTEISDAQILSMLNEVMAEIVLEFEPSEMRYDHTISLTTATGAGPYSLYAGTLRTYDGRNSTSGSPFKEIDEARYNILKVGGSTGDPIFYCRIGTTATDPTVHQVYVWPTPTRTNSAIVPSLVMPTELTVTSTVIAVRLNRNFDSLIMDIAIGRLLRGDRQYDAANAYRALSDIDARKAMLRKRTKPRSAAPGKLHTRFRGLG
jgi:hypothetical protein